MWQIFSFLMNLLLIILLSVTLYNDWKKKNRDIFFFVDDESLFPIRATEGSAGYDFTLKEDVTIPAHGTVRFNSGVYCQMPSDVYLALHIRSSLGAKGIILANATGIIDSDYFNTRLPIKGLLWNTTDEDITLKKGDRYMQGVLMPYFKAKNEIINPLPRIGGFGSTNKTKNLF